MPSLEKHMEISRNRTGKTYREVHEWMNHPDFRENRHDITRVLEIAEMFTEQYGKEAAQEYVQHLADDMKSMFGSIAEQTSAAVHEKLVYFGAEAEEFDHRT